MTNRSVTHWTGGLHEGSGRVRLESSNLRAFDVSFPTRTSEPEGHTSPEQLIAAAHSSSLARNISGVLATNGLQAESIDVAAEATLDVEGVGGFVISIALGVRVKLSGVDAAQFAELITAAERMCPVGKALGRTMITLYAELA